MFEIYKNAELHENQEQLGKRGGAYYSDAACECIRAIYANKKIHMVVSTQNNGAISCLDDDSIVEVSSIIQRQEHSQWHLESFHQQKKDGFR